MLYFSPCLFKQQREQYIPLPIYNTFLYILCDGMGIDKTSHSNGQPTAEKMKRVMHQWWFINTYLFKVNCNSDKEWEVFGDKYLSCLAFDEAFKPECFLSKIQSILLHFIEDYCNCDYEAQHDPPIFSEV